MVFRGATASKKWTTTSEEKSLDRDDLRAAAAAFSQLTGVLGGFCITVLVLVLDSDNLAEHKAAQDWVAGLLLLAGVSSVYSSGFLTGIPCGSG